MYVTIISRIDFAARTKWSSLETRSSVSVNRASRQHALNISTTLIGGAIQALRTVQNRAVREFEIFNWCSWTDGHGWWLFFIFYWTVHRYIHTKTKQKNKSVLSSQQNKTHTKHTIRYHMHKISLHLKGILCF